MPDPGEEVLAVPAEDLAAAGDWRGFAAEWPGFDAVVWRNPRCQWVPRGQAEHDPAWVQLVPYAVLRAAGKIFAYRRGAAGGETRLHRLVSIGVGGHVNRPDQAAADDSVAQCCLAALRRELAEEIGWDGPLPAAPIGALREPATFVGSLHLGLAYLLDVPAAEVSPQDPSLTESGWRTAAELAELAAEMETWSQFLLPTLAER